MTAPLLSIVVPCYNEEGSVPMLLERLRSSVAPYDAQGVEIILVDDGSTDRSWQLIEQSSATDKRIAGIRLSRNFGHQIALACGLDHSRGERVLVIDADLQDPPELLAEMMEKMDEGFDVVYGQRTERQGEGPFKRGSAWAFYRLLSILSDVAIPSDAGDFRLMRQRVVDALTAMPERTRFTRGMVSWLGFRQSAVEYTRAPRASGQTHYSLRAMLRLAGAALTGFSTQPLRLPLWLGIILMGFSLLLAVYALGAQSLPIAVVAGFLLLTALTWLMIGILGSYVGVILREVKGRPLYLVDQIINR